MSEKFEVGEVVIGQRFVYAVEYNGMEGIVVGGLRIRSGACTVTKEELESNCYLVEWADGEIAQIDPPNLRKKRPPASDESAHRQAMLDCIERAKSGIEVPA